MKLKYTALAIALLLPVSSQTMAEVTLELPDNVRLLAVNEADINKGWGSIFKTSDDSITLADGQSQIVYQIDHYFYKGDKQSERFRSGPLILTFTATDTSLTLTVPEFSDITQAEKYTQQPTPKLKNHKGASYPFKHDFLALKGLSINHDYADYVKTYNQKGGIAALTGLSSITAVTETTPEPAAPINTTSNSKTAEKPQIEASKSELAGENLKYWFSQADASTRKEFVSWAVQNL
ncbi:DUF2057 domain-containing protein [Photobacterium makurazakiensis]|uniref:YccT family protein n=1 Tax=Photobacterium makurazakiensis TaxID=2910234 RepID=UPI003D0C05B3